MNPYLQECDISNIKNNFIIGKEKMYILHTFKEKYKHEIQSAGRQVDDGK